MKKAILLIVILSICLACFTGCSLGLFDSNRDKSAYEIAKDNGFEGSELEWLESIKGNSGVDGADGKSLDINDIYSEYLLHNPNTTFEEFLKLFLNFEYTPTYQNVIAQALCSTVSIFSEITTNNYSAGSGVIFEINKKTGLAYIITNYHVLYDSGKICDKITLQLYGMLSTETIKAEYVGGSADYDIAVLKATDDLFKADWVKPVIKADSNEVAVGEAAIAIGNPSGLGISATLGIVSVDSEYITMNSINSPIDSVDTRVLRVDTAINGGNSGGGLFNGKGELIGIVNAKYVDDEIENIGFAIPSNVAVNLSKNIIYNATDYSKNAKVLTLGVTTQIKSSSAVFDDFSKTMRIEEEIAIIKVEPNSYASGKLLVGDKILSAKLTRDGGKIDKIEKITRSFQLRDFILQMLNKDTLTITVERDNVEKTITFAPSDTNYRTSFKTIN